MLNFKIEINENEIQDLKDIRLKVFIFEDDKQIDSLYYVFDNYKDFATGKNAYNILTLKGYGFRNAGDLDRLIEFINLNTPNSINTFVKDFLKKKFDIEYVEVVLSENE